MNARIVGEIHRHDACLGAGGSGRAWADPDLPLGRPFAADVVRPESPVLVAITSRYEDARARIMSAEAGTPAEAEVGPAPAGWSPTVPVDLGPGLPRPPRAHRDLPDRAPERRGNGLLRTMLTWLGADAGHAHPAPLLPY